MNKKRRIAVFFYSFKPIKSKKNGTLQLFTKSLLYIKLFYDNIIVHKD